MKKQYKLVHGDCLTVMKKIPDNSIDLVLCDLPYGQTASGWDVIIPFEPLWEQYMRIGTSGFGTRTKVQALLIVKNARSLRMNMY